MSGATSVVVRDDECGNFLEMRTFGEDTNRVTLTGRDENDVPFSLSIDKRLFGVFSQKSVDILGKESCRARCRNGSGRVTVRDVGRTRDTLRASANSQG